jgi:hypothetical protein
VLTVLFIALFVILGVDLVNVLSKSEGYPFGTEISLRYLSFTHYVALAIVELIVAATGVALLVFVSNPKRRIALQLVAAALSAGLLYFF